MEWWKWGLGGLGVAGGIWGVSKMSSKTNTTTPSSPAASGQGPVTSTFPPPTPTATTQLTSYLSPAFFQYISDMSHRWQAKGAKTGADDIMLMLLVESGVKPTAVNPSSGCAGLNQICPTRAGDPMSGLHDVGFTGTKQEYLNLTAEAQMPFVERFFTNGNHFAQMRDVGSLYLCNFSPAFLGKDPHFVMYRAGQKAYDQNKGVDFGNKGFIEVDDMRKFMLAGAQRNAAKFNELRFRLSQVGKTGNV